MRHVRSIYMSTMVAFAVTATVCAATAPGTGRSIRRTPIVTAVEKVRESVVNISTERVVEVRRGIDPFFHGRGDVFDRMFEDFFGPHYRRRGRVERQRVEIPLGSGSIITADGLVITNEHVVRRATNLKLTVASGETYDAELLVADPEEDLALLRAKADKALKAIPMGTSADIMLGETVIGLGNPFGFENSVTSGIISAVDREISVGSGDEEVKYKGLIQTSALINPGNSGGPLVNVLGQLIGINAAIVDQAQGIGFSIPIDRARDVLAPLLAAPQVSEAWPGFTAVTTEKRNGVRVTQVERKSAAADVLDVGDIICEADGVPVHDLFDLLLGVVQHKPGDKMKLRASHGGKLRDVTLSLGKMPLPTPKKVLYDKFGIAGQAMTPTLARQLGVAVDHGVLVSEVWRSSPALKVGMQRGDVIIRISPHPIRNLRDAAAALRSVRAGDRVFVRVVRGVYSAGAWITAAK